MKTESPGRNVSKRKFEGRGRKQGQRAKHSKTYEKIHKTWSHEANAKIIQLDWWGSL
jgi:hypothetical protein